VHDRRLALDNDSGIEASDKVVRRQKRVGRKIIAFVQHEAGVFTGREAQSRFPHLLQRHVVGRRRRVFQRVRGRRPKRNDSHAAETRIQRQPPDVRQRHAFL
jgi:hypothetical protein